MEKSILLVDDDISEAFYQSTAHKLILPRPQTGVTWIGVEPWQEKKIVEEVCEAIRRIAAGENPEPARRLSLAALVVLILASLCSLLILIPLLIQLISILLEGPS